MYDIKALYEAGSVEEAIHLLVEHPQAQILAGGSDVLVQIREGKRAGAELVSIYGIDAMRGVSYDEEEAIRIGSLTSFSHIAADPIIKEKIPVLGEAVSLVGGPQIRNIGTIGQHLQRGDQCHRPLLCCRTPSWNLQDWRDRRLPIDFYIKVSVVDLSQSELQPRHYPQKS